MLDDLYQRCVLRLPPDLVGAALHLPQLLGLAPAGVGWGDAFKHEITLGAPGYFEEVARAPEEQIEHAVTAHMLAVIEAFGNDRVADGQVADSARLHRLLDALRSLRDEVAFQVDRDAPARFRAADRTSREAIVSERFVLAAVTAVDTETYVQQSLGKQAVGFPGTLMLFGAPSARVGARELAAEALRGVWLGLQFRDDVVDWEDDWQNGGAWAVCLARHLHPEIPIELGAPIEQARALVLKAGVPQLMLELARAQFWATDDAALELCAFRLADWAREQASELDELIQAERQSPGYAVRQHRLRFAMEILSA